MIGRNSFVQNKNFPNKMQKKFRLKIPYRCGEILKRNDFTRL